MNEDEKNDFWKIIEVFIVATLIFLIIGTLLESYGVLANLNNPNVRPNDFFLRYSIFTFGIAILYILYLLLRNRIKNHGE